MNKATIRAFLEAFAVGDAYGKATEQCTRQEIEARYDRIDTLLAPEDSLTHEDLFHGQVTDDTEQVVYLIREYADKGCITPYDTAMALLRWVNETDAANKYIGANSLNALRSIAAGADVTTTGLNGITCGGMMRTPAAFFMSPDETLVENVVNCLMPTHYTGVAIESAVCYAFALRAAMRGYDMQTILDEACKGAELGKPHGSQLRVAAAAPSCAARIRFLARLIPQMADEQAVKEFLYDVLGTTQESCDCCAAAFALFIWAKEDVHLAIRLATEMGGDTDTIACLAAGLCTLFAGGHNLPAEMVQLVSDANRLDFDELAAMVIAHRAAWEGANA
ncbi:MAG: ADP-ribosylglycohydrolase family protein [Clostridia bacterium]|nr:ADP-ribosylglycohydrolase family protein [Clostridia bacterium]